MRNFFKKSKDTIEFVSLVSGVTEMHPVFEAKKFKPNWAIKALSNYKERIKTEPNFNHIALCPGIFDLFKTGYIVPAWHDTLVRTNGDQDTFQWAVPNFEELGITGVNQPVGTHLPEISNMLPHRPGSLKGVVKFNTPWRIIAPKGIKFIVIPIAYQDDCLFDASIGILDPAISNEINIQVNWNGLNGEYKVKAGTPMCQLIPMTERNLNYVVRTATKHDLDWEDKKNYGVGSTFFPARKKLSEMWYKHFKL